VTKQKNKQDTPLPGASDSSRNLSALGGRERAVYLTNDVAGGSAKGEPILASNVPMQGSMMAEISRSRRR
jgi:hypothetical protein